VSGRPQRPGHSDHNHTFETAPTTPRVREQIRLHQPLEPVPQIPGVQRGLPQLAENIVDRARHQVPSPQHQRFLRSLTHAAFARMRTALGVCQSLDRTQTRFKGIFARMSSGRAS